MAALDGIQLPQVSPPRDELNPMSGTAAGDNNPAFCSGMCCELGRGLLQLDTAAGPSKDVRLAADCNIKIIKQLGLIM